MRTTSRRAIMAPTATCAAAQDKPRLAIFTDASAGFSTIARRGAENADADNQVEFIGPAVSTPAEQRRIIDDLLARGVAGVAISPLSTENAPKPLDRVAAGAVLFTSDSDAPESDRVVCIGADNVPAGVQVARR